MGKLAFRAWCMNESDSPHGNTTVIGMRPDDLAMMRACFAGGFDYTPMLVYADYVQETPRDSEHLDNERLANAIRAAAEGKKTGWVGDVSLMQAYAGWQRPGTWSTNDHSQNTLIYTPSQQGTRYAYIDPGETAYRLSLNNAQWSAFTNTGGERCSVVSGRVMPNDDQRYQYVHGTRITHRDFRKVSPAEVPDKVICLAFWYLVRLRTFGR